MEVKSASATASHQNRANSKNCNSSLFISPLNKYHSEEFLRLLFSQYGSVVSVKIIRPLNGKSPYGFINFETGTSATKAFEAFQGDNDFDFYVNFSRTRPNKSSLEKKDPKICSHCEKATLLKCRNCEVCFCPEECTLSGWRHHLSSKCLKFSPLVSISVDGNVQADECHDSKNAEENSSCASHQQQVKSATKAFEAFQGDKNLCYYVNFSRTRPNKSSLEKKDPNICSLCEKAALFKCSICSISFCSEECKMDGWKDHLSCKCFKFANLNFTSKVFAMGRKVGKKRKHLNAKRMSMKKRIKNLNNARMARRQNESQVNMIRNFANVNLIDTAMTVDVNKSITGSPSPLTPSESICADISKDIEITDNAIASKVNTSNDRTLDDLMICDSISVSTNTANI